MGPHCRHIMISGEQCHGYALRGEDLCYFHNRQRRAAQTHPGGTNSIEIPLLEDRCAIQVTIVQVLRAIADKTIDRKDASLLLYGLQLSLQSVDRSSFAIPLGTVEDLARASDGEELAVDPGDDEDEDDDDEDDDDEDDDEEDDDDEDDEEEGGDEDDDSKSTEKLVAEARFLESVSNAIARDDMRLAARLLKDPGS